MKNCLGVLLVLIAVEHLSAQGDAQLTSLLGVSTPMEKYSFPQQSAAHPKSFELGSSGQLIEVKPGDFLPAEKEYKPSRFYGKLWTGTALVSPGSYRVQSQSPVFFTDQNGVFRDTTLYSQGKRGIGGGIRMGFGIGFILNDFLNIGLDVEFNNGHQLSNRLDIFLDPFEYDSTYDRINYKVTTISPYITFKALARPRYFIYNKLGILFTMPFDLRQTGMGAQSYYYGTWPTAPPDSGRSNLFHTNRDYQSRYKISLGIGFNVAFGINWRLNSRLRCYGELFGNFTALKPSRSTITTRADSKSYHYTAEYDFSVFPAQLLYYSQHSSESIEHETTETKYSRGGSVRKTIISHEDVSAPDFLESFTVYDATEKRFTVNMNTVGINVGFIYRF